MMPEPNRRTRAKRAAENHGRRAERVAGLWLTCKFYRLLGRRVKTQAGEIDLVAMSPSGVLCFIEVKARSGELAAGESLGLRQRARIARAAALYLGARPGLRHKGVRFDAILVVRGSWPRHVRDAWRPE